jgi:hypothetical protein
MEDNAFHRNVMVLMRSWEVLSNVMNARNAHGELDQIQFTKNVTQLNVVALRRFQMMEPSVKTAHHTCVESITRATDNSKLKSVCQLFVQAIDKYLVQDSSATSVKIVNMDGNQITKGRLVSHQSSVISVPKCITQVHTNVKVVQQDTFLLMTKRTVSKFLRRVILEMKSWELPKIAINVFLVQ